MLTTIAVVIIFYLLIPITGAFQVRWRWRSFRRWVRLAYRAPALQFQDLQVEVSGTRNTCRFLGKLEAFEGRDRLWLGDGKISVPVDIRGADVAFLEDDENFPRASDEWCSSPPPPEPPRRVPWTRLGVLPESTSFLVWGRLSVSEQARVQFASSGRQPLLVIAYEGDSETVLPRALWSGRQSVEYWNPLTPLSLMVGFVALLLTSYMELRLPGSRAAGIISLAFALVPSTFFLPPGIFFFYGFIRLWTRSRHYRALRDLATLPETPHEELRRKYKKKARTGEVLAHIVFIVGAGLNAVLLVFLLRFWIY